VPTRVDQGAVRLACEGVTVRFGSVEALRDVTVVVQIGEQVVVTGQAASGKTTWLKCLAGLQRPNEGTVLWGHDDVATLTIEERRSRQSAFGMVFQNDALFDSMTVLENVLLPLTKRGVARSEALERADEVLRRVGLDAARKKHPEELSGGMKKRAGVARAIVSKPAVLLADDPFAGLDPMTEQSIGELLLEVSRGRTLVVAVPDPVGSLPLARVLRFEAGRLIGGAP
jgi:phospholipid/cholesterol/gamma-HCH transport system ATP-binding protein